MTTLSLRSAGCAALLAAALLAGCQDSDGNGDTADTASDPTTASTTASTPAASGPGYAGPTIPDVLWTRHMTLEQALANAEQIGLTPGQVHEAVGDFSEELAFSFKVGEGVWAQYQAVDGGEAEVGDSGSFTYDADGNWSTVSNSTGCPGCVGVIGWSLDGDELTLDLLPGYEEELMAKFVTEGTYTRASQP